MSQAAAALADPVAAARSRPWRMLIGGQLVDAEGGRTYETWSPSTEELIASVPAATPADVDRAVRAAQDGFEVWRRMSVRDRAGHVRALATVMLEHEEELGLLDAIDGGNPVTAMRADVRMATDLIEYYADSARELKGQTIPASDTHLHYTVREPFGVVARIIPYNHPLMFAAAKVAAPLIAGNAVVLKAPDQTPLSALRLGELFADVLPPGVLNYISGHGAEAGDALVRHPGIRRIAFIGSVPTGLAIQRAAAESAVKTVSLELGGKNPLIAFPDADVDELVTGAVHAMNFHWTGGQSCGSTSRLLVHESIADEVVERVRQEMARVRIGDPLDPQTEMGSMVSAAQRDKVMRYVEQAKAEGARLVAGGGPPGGVDRGYFVAPTMFDHVRPDMTIASEEIFGPVLSVIRWRDEEEAIAIANGVDYGLTASIWTADIQRAHRVARQVEAGFVWINHGSKHYTGVPFGGFKDSGLGREEDLEELLSYTQVKAVNVPVGQF